MVQIIERAVSVTEEKIEAAWNHSDIASLEAKVAGLKTQLENLQTETDFKKSENIKRTEEKIIALQIELDSMKDTGKDIREFDQLENDVNEEEDNISNEIFHTVENPP